MSSINLTHHFLIAMPNMADPYFSRTLTYICEHNDQGALGLVVNRPIDMTLQALFERLSLTLRDGYLAAAPIYFGGPVQTDRGFVLHEPAVRTVLAFDFGLKRIGVAVGEPELATAHPLPAIAGFAEIEKLVAEWRPARLVVGLPVRELGAHPLARRVEKFARRLEGRFKLPVARVDERFSSVEAESRLRGIKHKSIDSVAAQLILEQYFHEAA